MIKKIALASVFAVASIVSFSASTVNAAKPAGKTAIPSVSGPVMQSFCVSANCR